MLGPHHDGSDLYVSNAAPALGEDVTFRVRIPLSYAFDHAVIRYDHDGEPRTAHLSQVSEDAVESWWEITIPVINPRMCYRFLFSGPGRYDWLNAVGLHDHDVHSNSDFQIVARPAYPTWLKDAIFYQIFPDRFASSGQKQLPAWAKHRDWNAVAEDGTDDSQHLCGGDLKGVEDHLDYITELGVTGIYFTPVFPAQSNHRYDASTFDRVDPVLGGDEAWFSLRAAADRAGIRLVGDLTTNHCGIGHHWMQTAVADPSSKEHGYFYWDSSFPWGYVAWWNFRSLPKLNFASQALRHEMYEGSDSVIQRWLSPKFGLSGWRIDVGNMTGRLGAIDHHDDVMHGIRDAMDAVAPDAWLVAENGDFVASDLAGKGWHGTMNYQGFMRPLTSWMNRNAKLSGGFQGLPVDAPLITGKQFVSTVKEFNGAMPWRSLTASMILLDSHDTPRFRSIVGQDRRRHLAAMTMLLTSPGVPSIFMGDEIGLEGNGMQSSRSTIDWEDRSKWDTEFLSQVKELTSLRRSADALINGGLRWIAAENNYVAYLRESAADTVLVVVTSNACEVEIDLSPFGYHVAATLFGRTATGQRIEFSTDGADQGVWRLS